MAITTSSLLKLANHAMHGSETWYTCVLESFHDNHRQKIALGTFSYNYFFTSQTCTPSMHGSETWYACVFQSFHDDHEQKMASGNFSYDYLSGPLSALDNPLMAWGIHLKISPLREAGMTMRAPHKRIPSCTLSSGATCKERHYL